MSSVTTPHSDPDRVPASALDLCLGSRPASAFRPWGKLYLCSQTLKRVSSRPALDFSCSPSPTSQDTLTPRCKTDTQTLSGGQRSLNKEPVTINTVQGRARGEGPDTVASASRLQGPAERVKRWEPSSGEGTRGGLGENQDGGSRAKGPGKWIDGFRRVDLGMTVSWVSPRDLARVACKSLGRGQRSEPQGEEPGLGVAMKVPEITGLVWDSEDKGGNRGAGVWGQRAHE